MTNPEIFDVIRSPEMPLRADIIATDTLPVTGARLAASALTGAIEIPAKSVKIEMWFSCSVADTPTSVFSVFMRRKGGDWRLAFVTATTTVGSQLNTNGEYLADTSGAVTGYWSTVTVLDGGGADGCTRLLFSTLGYDEIAVYQTTRSSGDTWHVYWSVYTYDG